MQEFLSQFHFLRPWWLLALLPALALAWLLWRQRRRSSQWQQVIQPELLRHLLEGSLSRESRWQFAGLLAAWLIACLALAGPAWERLPQPVHQSEAAVVVVFDMSPSMVAEDVKPSRLQRARFKLRDFLDAREEGLTALVAYAGEAHVVSPLTDDADTVANLLPALHPDIMPLRGSNVEMAIDRALQLFEDAGIERGEILLVTDEVADPALPEIREMLGSSPVGLSILGVGSAEGAPIPTGEGGFARGRNNDIVIAKLNNRELRELARDLGGVYAGLTADDRDLGHIRNHIEREAMQAQQQRLVERTFDTWRDGGQWLALLLLPFAALAFRRGWLLSVGLLGVVGLTPDRAVALEWEDLWLRSDQQGLRELEAGNPAQAAEEFEDHDWRGTALYRSDNFPAAAEAFARGTTPGDHYNRGNALAKAGKLQAALTAYEQALQQRPDFADAEFNAELVRELLEQQREQEQSGAQEQENQEAQNQEQQQQQQQAQSSGSGEQDSEQKQAQDQQQAEAGDEEEQDQSGAQNPAQEQNQTVNEEAAAELADRQSEDQEEGEQEQARAAQQLPEDGQPQDESSPEADMLAEARQSNQEDAEEQQALDQWLRQVPDDPSGLLRRKFEYEHRRMRQGLRNGDWLPPANQSGERW